MGWTGAPQGPGHCGAFIPVWPSRTRLLYMVSAGNGIWGWELRQEGMEGVNPPVAPSLRCWLGSWTGWDGPGALMMGQLMCDRAHHTANSWSLRARMCKVMGSDELQLPWSSLESQRMLHRLKPFHPLQVCLWRDRGPEQCGPCSGKYCYPVFATADANFSLTATFSKFIWLDF